MNVSIIITTYNRPEALKIVINSIDSQTYKPSEIIIADDGSGEETSKLIENLNKNSNLKIIHSWQEDKGFRAARSRNKAILRSSSDYIILIDGDMILDRFFIKDHLDNAKEGQFLQGSRVLLSEKLTNQIIKSSSYNLRPFSIGINNRKNALRSKILSDIFSYNSNNAHGIRSCNMSFFKSDCLKVNGFNNSMEGWGREDSEFAVRMLNSNISRRNIKFSALQFHLWHPNAHRSSLKANDKILNDAINLNLTYCENGIDQLRLNE